MEFQGIITAASQPITSTSKAGKEYTRQQFMLEEVGTEHPHRLAVTVIKDYIRDYMASNMGHEVLVCFYTDAREYNGKFYMDATCWDCKVNGVSVREMAHQAPTNNPAVVYAKDVPPVDEKVDALPF